MSPFFIAVSIWLHSLAMTLFVGYFLVLSLICLPSLAPTKSGAALGEISKRSRPWLYGSILVFMFTGIYLMIIDSAYLGFMDLSNVWGIAMFVKHVLIVAMLVAGFWYNAIQRVGMLLRSNSGVDQGIAQFRTFANIMSLCGVLVLLLTSLAQIQPQ